MKHGLAGAGAVIDDHSVSLPVEPFIIRYFFCRQEEMSDEFPVCIVHAVNIGNVFFGNDEQVDGRLRVHVFKSGDRIVLVHDFGGDFFFDDFAEDTVGIASHAVPPYSEKLRKKQQRDPVWQAGPVCSTLTKSVSWSQS